MGSRKTLPSAAALAFAVLLAQLCMPPWLLPAAQAATAAEWRSATIYQLLTDRFASPSSAACTDLRSYCGGNFNSIVSQLPYLQEFGVDAIWISPVVDNTPGGYHGYWAKNLSSINPRFGTRQDLKNLVGTFHQAGMKVMVDVVANHMGPVGTDYSQLWPFNRPEHYHCCSCSDCAENCNIPDSAFEKTDPASRQLVTKCRLAGLPDLNQDNAFVRLKLKRWVKDLVKTFGFDGLRIDTVPEVDGPFWAEFVKAAAVFATGEVFSGNLQLIAPYNNYVGSTLNYPMYFTLKKAFGADGWPPQSLHIIRQTRNEVKQSIKDPTVLANFIDNHDNPRFLSLQNDWHLYFNAFTYMVMSEGIPIVYYGSEAAFSGGADPANREPMWTSGYKTGDYMFKFMQAVIKYRKQYQLWNHPHQEVFVSDNCYVFSRGPVMVALTNVGSYQDNVTCTFELPYAILPTPALAQVNTSVTVTFRYGAPALFATVPGPNSFQPLESMALPIKTPSPNPQIHSAGGRSHAQAT